MVVKTKAHWWKRGRVRTGWGSNGGIKKAQDTHLGRFPTAVPTAAPVLTNHSTIVYSFHYRIRYASDYKTKVIIILKD